MVMALSGIALAKAPVAMVTGTYTYLVGENPGAVADGHLQRPGHRSGLGYLVLDDTGRGHDRPGDLSSRGWSRRMARRPGDVRDVRVPTAFLWVHDGGTPGSRGDTAFTWRADPEETLVNMEALCESMATSPYGLDPFPVESGNLIVHGSR